MKLMRYKIDSVIAMIAYLGRVVEGVAAQTKMGVTLPKEAMMISCFSFWALKSWL